MTISKELRINEEIRCKEVRLVDDAGQQLGVMSPREAAKVAAEKGLDLVEVAPTANPPENINMSRAKRNGKPRKISVPLP